MERLASALKIVLMFTLLLGTAWIYYTLTGKSQKQSLHEYGDFHYAYFMDSENRYSIDTIQQADFTPLPEISLSKGFSPGSLWLKIEGVDTTPGLYLFLEETFINYIDYWYKQNGRWEEIRGGDLRPITNRPLQIRSEVFPVPAGSAAVYARFSGSSTKNIHATILSRSEALRRDNLLTLYYGLFLGAIAVMILYNLFMYLSLGDISFLYYSLFKSSFFAAHLYLSGFQNLYLWPDNPVNNKYLVSASVAFLPFFMSLFLSSILKIRERNFILQRVMNGIIILSGIFTAFMLLSDFENRNRYSIMFLSLYVPLILALVVYRGLRGDTIARYFSIAWLANILFGFITVLGASGLLDSTFFVLHASEVGGLLETVLLSFVVGYRYHLFRKESEAIEKKYDELLLRLESRQKSSRIASLDVATITERIKLEAATNQDFYQPDFSLQKFAETLGIRSDQLSEILNSELRLTFADFIKRIRIHKSCELIRENPERKIIDVAYESGFGSKSSFNQVFSEVMEMTPTQFRNTV